MKKTVLILICMHILSAGLYPREALIVLGGVFGKKPKMKKVEKVLKENLDYDIYVIDYIRRSSLELSYSNMVRGIAEVDTARYDKVHFLCYIFGGKLIMRYFTEHQLDNLGRIILDRSPLEEVLPDAVKAKGGDRMVMAFGGPNLLAYSLIEYFKLPVYLKDKTIGLIIEKRAIGLCYLFEEEIIALKPSFDPVDLMEHYDDYFYVSV